MIHFQLRRVQAVTRGHRVAFAMAAVMAALGLTVGLSLLPVVEEAQWRHDRREQLHHTGWAELTPRENRDPGALTFAADAPTRDAVSAVLAPGRGNVLTLRYEFWPSSVVARPSCVPQNSRVELVVGDVGWLPPASGTPYAVIPPSLAEGCTPDGTWVEGDSRHVVGMASGESNTLLVAGLNALGDIDEGGMELVSGLWIAGGVDEAGRLADRLERETSLRVAPVPVAEMSDDEVTGILSLASLALLTGAVGVGAATWLLVAMARSRAREDAVELLNGCPRWLLVVRHQLVAAAGITLPLGVLTWLLVDVVMGDSASWLWWLLPLTHLVLTAPVTWRLAFSRDARDWKENRS